MLFSIIITKANEHCDEGLERIKQADILRVVMRAGTKSSHQAVNETGPVVSTFVGYPTIVR